jgi:hypothetical protein
LKGFRKFISSRWQGLPVGVMSLILAAVLVAGGVSATVLLLGGSATVTVQEAITITQSTPVDGTVGGSTWSSMTWSVSTYPGETKTLTVKLTNAGSVGIPVTISLTGDPELTKVIKVWNGSGYETYGTSYTISGGGDGYVQFQITASTGSSIGDKILNLSIDR